MKYFWSVSVVFLGLSRIIKAIYVLQLILHHWGIVMFD